MFEDNRKPFKIHNGMRIVMYTNLLLPRIFYKAILVSDLYRLPRCIVPYKQCLSYFKNNLRDAFINTEKITFYKPVGQCSA